MPQSQSAYLLLVCLLLALPAHSVAGDGATVDLGTLFEGSWEMEGRFRHTPDMPWIPTGSRLVAAPKLGGSVVARDIEAPQIDFSAFDVLTYSPRTGAVQYIYASNQDTSALIFEGTCTDDCRALEFSQVCGPAWPYPACEGRTSITFESDSRFVARDTRPGPDGEPFMTREVVYTRVEAPRLDLASLAGTWRLDLRPAPDAEPYFQELVISVDGDRVEGSFYNTAFRDFHFNGTWSDPHFAFVTQDGSGGLYNTSVRLIDGRLEGTTHSLGRGFLSVWTGERSE